MFRVLKLVENQISNLQRNRDYKIKSAYDDSDEKVAQRDYYWEYDYQHDYKHKKRNFYDNILIIYIWGGSHEDFDNIYLAPTNIKEFKLKTI